MKKNANLWPGKKVVQYLTKGGILDILIIVFILSQNIMTGEVLESSNIKFNEADKAKETLLNKINAEMGALKLKSIEEMNKTQLANFIEKEFKNDKQEWLTYGKMKEKGQSYAFVLEAAMDFICDALGDKKYTEEGKVDEDGKLGGKTLDERLGVYGGIDATYDEKNTKIVELLQSVLGGITVDGFAGPETMANIAAFLKGEKIESIQVEGYDENKTYKYNKIADKNKKEDNIDRVEEKDMPKEDIVKKYHTILKADGTYRAMPGYHLVLDNGVIKSVVKNGPLSKEEAIKDLAKYHLVQDTKDGKITPGKGYIWANEKDSNDYNVIGNEYELKTKNIDELTKIALGTQEMTDTEYKALNGYDLMIIYAANPKFNFGKEVDNTTKKEEAKKTVTEKTVVSVDTSKKLDSDMYDEYTDKIEKIKINDFVDKYKTKYPGIGKLFDGILLVTVNESNPYFQIRYKNVDTNTQTGNISMRDCMDTDTFDFSQDKFFEKLLSEVTPTIEVNAKKERDKTILSSIRGKTFSKSDLFGTTKDKDKRYDIYFKAFNDNLVEIDSGMEYTKISGDNLLFRLDDAGLDKDYNKDLSISIDKITNEKGVLDLEKGKKELAAIISNIIDTNLS